MDTVDYDNFNNLLRMHENYNDHRENTHSNSSSQQEKRNLKSNNNCKEPHFASPWQSSQGSYEKNHSHIEKSCNSKSQAGKKGINSAVEKKKKNKNLKPPVNPWGQSYPGSHGVPIRENER